MASTSSIRGGSHPSCTMMAVLLTWAASAWAQPLPRAVAPPARTTEPAAASRSAVFDNAAADVLRRQQEPEYVERIFVEGRDPDVRVRRRSLEQTFAESLLAPSPAAAMGLRKLSTTPCYAVQSSLNTIGASYAPLTGCPGAANTP